MEFKEFEKIERIGKLKMFITQKIHGTNAQVCIYVNENGDTVLKCGSRSRWITPEDDNYGFARHVHDNSEQYIEKLGVGRHFGEWCGPGINSGEGLGEKIFVLFDFWKHPPEKPLPPKTVVVPVLYKGAIDFSAIDTTMDALKLSGSILCPGFMRPEGVVITVGDIRYKKVFNSEETAWKKPDEKYKLEKQAEREAEANALMLKFGTYLQPLRLEKLLSRDEKYLREFPKSIVSIVDDYCQDLISETENVPQEFKKEASLLLFKMVRTEIEKRI